MNQPFKSREVREQAETFGKGRVYCMLHAYADRLEADEKDDSCLVPARVLPDEIDAVIKKHEQDAKDASRFRRLLDFLPRGTLGDRDVNDIQSWTAAIDAIMAKESLI